MIKTIQYLAEADTSQVLVALDLKAAFQNVSRRAMLYSIAQTDADFAAVFSKWYTGTTEHTPKSVPTAEWIKDALSRPVVFRRPLTPYFGQFLRTFAHSTTQAPNSLPTWTTGTRYYRSSHQISQPLLYSPPRHRYGEPLARTPFHLSSKTRSHSHSAACVDIFKFMATSSPALLFWESRPPWRKQHNAFRELPPHLQTSMPSNSMRRQ